MGKIKYWLIVGFIILFAIFYIAISDRDSTLSRLKSAVPIHAAGQGQGERGIHSGL